MSPSVHARRPARALAGAFILAVAAAAVSSSLRAPLAGRAQSPISFETPTVVDPLQTGGEPDIAVDPQGRVFASAPTGTGTQRSVWYGSVDGGHTFRVISANKPADTITSETQPPGGGDTDIQFDRSGKQYFADLYALLCFRTATTSDGGATVASKPDGGCAKTNRSIADRQWLAVYDPAPGTPKRSAYTGDTPLVYMEYNNGVGVTTGSSEWVRSNDGLTFTDALAGHPGAETYAPFGADGYPSIDQVTGKVFEPAYNPGAAAGTSDILLNIGTPDANGDLTFLDAGNDTSKLITVAPGVLDDRGDSANFVVSSMDSGRNLWVAWVARSTDPKKAQTYVAVASAASGWTAWSKPVQVSMPTATPGSYTSIFPWIKAGGPGRADVVWYGANMYTDPSAENGQAWDVFMSQVVWPVDAAKNVSTGAAPSVDQVKVTPHPMHYGAACLKGTGCIAAKGNRNLADFFNISIDRSGAAEIVYDDTSNGLLQPGFPTSNQVLDHAGAPVITVARQRSGPGLYGNDVSGPSNAGVEGMPQAPGSALYPVIGGTNVPGMDVTGTHIALSGSTLKITSTITDLSNPAATGATVNGLFLQYVTRWQMGDTIYYAGYAANVTGQQPQFYAGAAQSVDLCSVSACDPHIVYYPETGPAAHAETGTVTCPATPSAATPCTLEIDVNVADVGNPTLPSSRAAGVAAAAKSPPLEEVGTYAFASILPQAALNNAVGQIDNVPLQVGGLCCFNWPPVAATSSSGGTPIASPAPGGGSTPASLPNTGGAPVASAAMVAALAGLVALAGGRRLRRRPKR
jgi:hypothetical protein